MHSKWCSIAVFRFTAWVLIAIATESARLIDVNICFVMKMKSILESHDNNIKYGWVHSKEMKHPSVFR